MRTNTRFSRSYAASDLGKEEFPVIYLDLYLIIIFNNLLESWCSNARRYFCCSPIARSAWRTRQSWCWRDRYAVLLYNWATTLTKTTVLQVCTPCNEKSSTFVRCSRQVSSMLSTRHRLISTPRHSIAFNTCQDSLRHWHARLWVIGRRTNSLRDNNFSLFLTSRRRCTNSAQDLCALPLTWRRIRSTVHV